MSQTVDLKPEAPLPSRRMFLSGARKATLSSAAVVLLAGCGTMATAAMKDGAAAQDAGILNVALGLEHEAIGAYQLGAESGLLQPAVLQTAVLFQSQHKEHRDALTGAIRSLGGAPVETKSLADYAADLQADTLRNQTDVLTLAARLERGATNAYLSVIPAFESRDLAVIAGRLAADETMHWTVLTQALGQPLPTSALSFGA